MFDVRRWMFDVSHFSSFIRVHLCPSVVKDFFALNSGCFEFFVLPVPCCTFDVRRWMFDVSHFNIFIRVNLC